MLEQYLIKAKSYVDAVRKSIVRDYDEVPAEWEAQLVQLEDMYATYLQCSDALRKAESPIIKINAEKTTCVDFNFTVAQQCVKSMDKILKSFGLSPISRKKLRGNTQTVDEEDFLDEL